jgi:hypothetical protein
MAFEGVPISAESILGHFQELTEVAKATHVRNGHRTPEQVLADTYFDMFEEVDAPPVCIEIIGNDGKKYIFGTLGNISVIKGKAKVSKSMMVSIILAAAMRNGPIANKVSCKFPAGKDKIVWFDTEQTKFHNNLTKNRAVSLAGGSPKDAMRNVERYIFRACSVQERIETIGYYLEQHPDVGLVIIDGVKELLTDINDPNQSTFAAQYLMDWTMNHNVHLLTVIHQNKNDKNARGHIGTEIINKAETVIDVEKDPYVKTQRIVMPAECRNMEFEKFAFDIDDNGVPHILQDWTENNESMSDKPKRPNQIGMDTHLMALKIVFARQKEIASSKFSTEIKIAFSGLGYDFGDHISREYVSYYVQNDMVNITKGLKNSSIYSFKDDQSRTPF